MADYTAYQGNLLKVEFENFPPDLTGPLLGIQLWNPDGSVFIGRTTANLNETPAHSGHYVWLQPIGASTTPSDDYEVALDFNNGTLIPGKFKTASVQILSLVAPIAPPPPSDTFVPTVADVGAILRTRTKDDMGAELATFTSATRPTDTEAMALIGQAYDDVVSVIDDDIPVAAYRDARSAIALRAAMLIELSFWPDQVPLGRSPYAQLKELYDGNKDTPPYGGVLGRVVMAVARETEEAASGEQTSTPLQPAYDFGNAGTVGLDTIW